ncbi:two-component system response regulator [Paucibacter sp. AS339]|uniref:response regulator n=1 Tax=Paucibacter hankyongi TaxID=3133434 RepID=UPI0030961037
MLADQRPTVLIVDDSDINLCMLNELLQTDYRVLACTSGPDALQLSQQLPRPDLILLDVQMPEMDGFAVLATLRTDPATTDIPVIFLTALTDSSDEERGLHLGAADYITKPFKPSVVLARVRSQIEAKRARDWLQDQNSLLEAEISRRMAENDQTQRVSIRALAHLAEIRDPETSNHLLRTQNYVWMLALRLREHPDFRDALSDRYIHLLTLSTPLHDIGKVGIPDSILFKPGPLDAEQWQVMRTHSMQGCKAIELAERDIDMPLEFLKVAKEIVRSHHEKWDGSGYPDGLAGAAIPISAQLMAMADMFDALISKRVYKSMMSTEEARAIIMGCSGKDFDPRLVEVFKACFDDFVAIAERFSED